MLMFIFQMFDRETRREKILDSRHREMKLKERTKSQQDGKVGFVLAREQGAFVIWGPCVFVGRQGGFCFGKRARCICHLRSICLCRETRWVCPPGRIFFWDGKVGLSSQFMLFFSGWQGRFVFMVNVLVFRQGVFVPFALWSYKIKSWVWNSVG